MAGNLDPFLLPPRFPQSGSLYGPRVASVVQPSGPRVPPVEGRWYRPQAPWVSGLLPLPWRPCGGGLTETVPGPGD